MTGPPAVMDVALLPSSDSGSVPFFPRAASFYPQRDSQFVGSNRILDIYGDKSLKFDFIKQIEWGGRKMFSEK